MAALGRCFAFVISILGGGKEGRENRKRGEGNHRSKDEGFTSRDVESGKGRGGTSRKVLVYSKF